MEMLYKLFYRKGVPDKNTTDSGMRCASKTLGWNNKTKKQKILSVNKNKDKAKNMKIYSNVKN